MTKHLPTIRAPKQKRSKDRSEQILAAARQIILKKGCAQLTITEIAEVAGITPSSMYQYYRNKSAIILALAEAYFDKFAAQMRLLFSTRVQHKAELTPLFMAALELHYRLYRDDPVVRDIWAGAQTDKALLQLDEQDTTTHLQLFYQIAASHFPSAAHSDLRLQLQVMLQMGVSGAELALRHTEAEGEQMIKICQQILSEAWLNFCKQYQDIV